MQSLLLYVYISTLAGRFTLTLSFIQADSLELYRIFLSCCVFSRLQLFTLLGNRVFFVHKRLSNPSEGLDFSNLFIKWAGHNVGGRVVSVLVLHI